MLTAVSFQSFASNGIRNELTTQSGLPSFGVDCARAIDLYEKVTPIFRKHGTINVFWNQITETEKENIFNADDAAWLCAAKVFSDYGKKSNLKCSDIPLKQIVRKQDSKVDPEVQRRNNIRLELAYHDEVKRYCSFRKMMGDFSEKMRIMSTTERIVLAQVVNYWAGTIGLNSDRSDENDSNSPSNIFNELVVEINSEFKK